MVGSAVGSRERGGGAGRRVFCGGSGGGLCEAGWGRCDRWSLSQARTLGKGAGQEGTSQRSYLCSQRRL